MLNAIPFFGWFLSFFFSFSLSVPFYFLWNALAPRYFYFMPPQYFDVPFWHVVGLFMLIPMFKSLIVPKFASISQTVQKTKKEA